MYLNIYLDYTLLLELKEQMNHFQMIEMYVFSEPHPLKTLSRSDKKLKALDFTYCFILLDKF